MISCVDVSQFQGVIDWPAHRAAGFDSAIIRVGDGPTYNDTHWVVNAQAAHAAGLGIVAYHFARVAQPPVTQGLNAVHAVQAAGVPIVRMMADLEDPNWFGPLPNHWLDDYLHELDQVGAPAAIYTNGAWWNPRVTDPHRYNDHPFIVAEWPSKAPPPADPANWSAWAYGFKPSGPTPPTGISNIAGWQFADNGTVAGIRTLVDCDLIYDPAFFKESAVADPILIRDPRTGRIDICNGPTYRHVDLDEYAWWKTTLGKDFTDLAADVWDAMHAPPPVTQPDPAPIAKATVDELRAQGIVVFH